jgi:hypothetical protein
MNKQDLENNLDRIHGWIKSVDQKIGIWLAFQSIFLTIITPYLIDKILSMHLLYTNKRISVLFVGCALIIISFFKVVLTFTPRISKTQRSKSILFFGDIADMGLDEFRKRVSSYSPSDFEDDLVSQSYISSVIVFKKFKFFQDSLLFFFIGFLVLAGLFTYIIIYGS